ncbi:MAG: alpha/beta hydrolase [Verrucomicrobiota bacterium]
MKPPKTILLIHGLWVTPSSWEKFRRYYESSGYTVLAPAWPGINGDVQAMQRDASSLKGIGIEEVIAHYTKIIRSLPEPPIIMGHSYGGLITQLLINKGFGAAGVAIDSVPPKGILILPVSTYLALTPAFLKPSTFKNTFAFTFKQWWKVFANTLPESEARVEYQQQAIPASGRAIFQAALSSVTSNSPATINFRNSSRAPLLFIGGGADVIMPAALNRKNSKKYKASSAVTEYKEFPGRSHYIIAEKGWEEVAQYALDWTQAMFSAKQTATAKILHL